MSVAAFVESPCIKLCTLDPSGEVCLGCFRTLDEIGHWPQLSNAERFDVLERLPKRRARFAATGNALGHPSGPPPAWKPLRCERCGAGFVCGADDLETPCWCTRYPPVAPSQATSGCLCPVCLAIASTS